MKKINLLPNGIFVLSLVVASFILANPITVGQSFVPWGKVANDESVIQPFITSRSTGQDFRIPQDMTTLDIDYFYVYLEWRGSNTYREFIVQLLEQKEREIIVGSQTSFEIYWEIYEETIVQVIKGSNEWNDPRFALVKVDNNLVSGLQKSDGKEKIRILYRDIEIEFFHLTSYAEVEQTKTVQQWNMEAIVLALWTIFLGFLAGIASRWILNKATYVPDLPHWSLWMLLFLIIAITAILFFLIAGYNLDEVLRVIILVPAPLVSVFFAIYFAFWLASKFRPKKLLEILFIILDTPTLDQVKSGERSLKGERELPVDGVIMEGYLTESGEIELVNDPDSYWETIRRLKMGGIKFSIKKLGKRIRVKQKLRNYDDIIFCEKFDKNDIEVKVKDGSLYSISSIIIIVGVFTWILPLFLSMASLITSILGTSFLLVGTLLFFWENVDISAPIVEVVPITDRDAVTIIRDRFSLDIKNNEIAELEMDLYEEKTTISKRAREQTMKALELLEDAIMPVKELSEAGQSDFDELPEVIKQAFKGWVDDWRKEGSLIDSKQIVNDKIKKVKD